MTEQNIEKYLTCIYHNIILKIKTVHCLSPVKYMMLHTNDTDSTATSKDILNDLQNEETEKEVEKNFY